MQLRSLRRRHLSLYPMYTSAGQIHFTTSQPTPTNIKGVPSKFSKPQQDAPEAYVALGRPRDMIRACGRNKEGSILNVTLLDLYTPKDYLFLGESGSPQRSRQPTLTPMFGVPSHNPAVNASRSHLYAELHPFSYRAHLATISLSC
jgi:hypothetical protein